MTLLTREQILEAQDLQTEQVEVPEWGGAVLVRGLTGAQRGDYLQGLVIFDGKGNRTGVNLKNTHRLVALCLVDENGKRLFTDADMKDLGGKSGAALERVETVALRLSGLDREDVEELTENFTETRNGDTGSA